jgi:diaminohydroxyphosphoribosylaminopyrimidine deaminase/5-amino-6-(5-phosphoribosylamino)uracil reductase
MFDSFDQQCMALALQLAENGMETSDPNPRVGCVLAAQGEVIATGWHRECGGPHAEVNALQVAGSKALNSTAYVTLEPCSYHGRTPACTEALISAGVRRVVCATKDPNPRIDGNGIDRLSEEGIKVEFGLMESQAEILNEGFFKRMREGRPWVRVKLAQSLDGSTALANGSSQWISSEAARADVQKWRARSSAIMVGIGTVLADDPSLNVRGSENSRQPLRIIVDSYWRTPATTRTLGLPGKVIIAGRGDIEIPRMLRDSKAELLALTADHGRVDLKELLTSLAEFEVNELQVEGGSTLAGALLDSRLVDELLIYQAPLLLGQGARNAFAFGPLDKMDKRVSLQWIETVNIGGDLRLRLKPKYEEN